MPTLTEWLAHSGLHRTLYHFTDVRNLASIRSHGLLSVRELERRGVAVPAPGGNQFSRDVDPRVGMDRYVHLCLMDEHPMEWTARQDGRIQRSVFLPVSPAVLQQTGVMFTDRVANQSGAVARPLGELGDHLDLEVVYTRTDWHDPAIKERRNLAKKYEILVPDHVPVSLLRLPSG